MWNKWASLLTSEGCTECALCGRSGATWAKLYSLPSVTIRKWTGQAGGWTVLFFPHVGPGCSHHSLPSTACPLQSTTPLVLNSRAWTLRWQTQTCTLQSKWGTWPSLQAPGAGQDHPHNLHFLPCHVFMQSAEEKEPSLQGDRLWEWGLSSLSGVVLSDADLGSRKVDFLSCFQLSSLFRTHDFQGGCQHCTALLVTVNPRAGELHNGNCEKNAK